MSDKILRRWNDTPEIRKVDAETKYDIKLYVKWNDVYQYGSAIEVTTEAAPADNT